MTKKDFNTSLEKANQILISHYESLNTDKDVTSDEQIKSILPFTARKKTGISRHISKKVACILAAAVFTGMLLFLFSGETSAIFFGWIKEQHKNYVKYISPKKNSNSAALKSYTVNYVPKDYSFENAEHDDGSRTLIYTTQSGDVLTIIYSSGEKEVEYYVHSAQSKMYSVSVNGLSADLYLSSDNQTPSAITWYDKENQLFFYILAPLPEEELIKIAENIKQSESALQMNTSERFLDALVKCEKKYYKEALSAHQQKHQKLLTQDTYIVKYQTIDKPVYTFVDYEEKPTAHFIVEIAYIYDTSTETPVKIFDAAISDVYLTSVQSCHFDNGGYNIRVEDNLARISSTGQFGFNDCLTSTQTYASTIRLQELAD